jgi:salicylate hydroxylase
MAWRGLIPIEKLPSHMQKKVGVNWVGPGRHVVHYPIRRGELMNFVGIVEKDTWQVESWNQIGSKEECALDFEGWHEDIHTMIDHIQTPYKWALMGRAPLSSWGEGVITLLGDACHPTLPFLAQGAMMALEDGIVLARCLEQGYDNIALALKRYERVRLERTNKIVVGSTENAKRFHNPKLKDLDGANEYVNSEWTVEKINARYTWLFEYDATSVDIGD